jgi:hypothetical protein
MARRILASPFDNLLSVFGRMHFTVAPASAAVRQVMPRAVLVSLHGIGAEIVPYESATMVKGGGGNGKGSVRIVTRSSLVLNGELARLVDHGYQKFFETEKMKVPATADALRGLHLFTEAFTAAVGGEIQYNEALGTTSDVYMYDRVKGRA